MAALVTAGPVVDRLSSLPAFNLYYAIPIPKFQHFRNAECRPDYQSMLVNCHRTIWQGVGGMLFATLLVQPDPSAAALHEIICDLHLNDGADTGKAGVVSPNRRKFRQAISDSISGSNGIESTT
jgi:hypothetical protein